VPYHLKCHQFGLVWFSLASTFYLDPIYVEPVETVENHGKQVQETRQTLKKLLKTRHENTMYFYCNTCYM